MRIVCTVLRGVLGGSAPSWGEALRKVFWPAAHGEAFFPYLIFLPALLSGLALGGLLPPRRPAPPDEGKP